MAVYTDPERPHESLDENVSTRQGEHGINRATTASPQSGRPRRTTSPIIFNPYYTGRPRTPTTANKGFTVDRQEIIRQRKELSRPTSPELERRKTPVPISIDQDVRSTTPQTPERRRNDEEAGMQIERPRSALHRGDFRERDAPEGSEGKIGSAARIQDTTPLFATSPVVPWDSRFPTSALQHGSIYRPEPTPHGIPIPSQRARAPSYSFGSSFVYRPPTSPLVQSSRPDTPDQSSRMRSRSPDKSRRHTFSPTYMHDYSSRLGMSPPGSSHTVVPTLRSERSYPCQALQPDRPRVYRTSASLPQSPMGHSRRISLSDSPLHHAPMVGSYEESILRGRMSTTPSKPLNFVAQIGVLGKGNCKPSLRCPSHVSIPFPAVFYSYGSGSKVNPTSDQPSPYVGLIDLENGLQSGDATERRRKQNVQSAMSPAGSRATSKDREEAPTPDEQSAQQRRRQKQKRRSGSPRAPSGGCYRIPPVGQLQIVIKNPNKTAVKLFLVPYDLSDMEPGQKTFIRQRSYSAGPIIDMPLSSRKNLGTDRPEAGINPSGDPQDKPILRYLIHLNICCPAKGRYFLFKSLRVVFANRVPDGKEKLRNEVQMPTPRYSAYKPDRNTPTSMNTATPPRRRSTMLDPQFSPIQESHWSPFSDSTTFFPLNHPSPFTSFTPKPFPILPTLPSRPQSRHAFDDDANGMDIDSPRDLRARNNSISLLQSPPSPTTTSINREHYLQQRESSLAPFSAPFDGASAFGITSSSSEPVGRGRERQGLFSSGSSGTDGAQYPTASSAYNRDNAQGSPFAPSSTTHTQGGPYNGVPASGIPTSAANISANLSASNSGSSGTGCTYTTTRPYHARQQSASLLSRRLRGLNVVVGGSGSRREFGSGSGSGRFNESGGGGFNGSGDGDGNGTRSRSYEEQGWEDFFFEHQEEEEEGR